MNKEELFKSWESEFYDKFSQDVILEEMHFQSIAIGFFVAKGLDIEESLSMYNYCVKNGKF